MRASEDKVAGGSIFREKIARKPELWREILLYFIWLLEISGIVMRVLCQLKKFIDS